MKVLFDWDFHNKEEKKERKIALPMRWELFNACICNGKFFDANFVYESV